MFKVYIFICFLTYISSAFGKDNLRIHNDAISLYYKNGKYNEYYGTCYATVNKTPFWKMIVLSGKLIEHDTTLFMVNLWVRIKHSKIYVFCSLINIESDLLRNGFELDTIPKENIYLHYNFPNVNDIAWGRFSKKVSIHITIYRQWQKVVVDELSHEDINRVFGSISSIRTTRETNQKVNLKDIFLEYAIPLFKSAS
ncbi:uncharacterized protein LOC142328084 [Lycorma delicatula]|uniref:uncharacterized protein LOC142328084 n=1 Tax=Lycorma delicatula TaxID=130591 RepID=UPI003F513F44